MSRRNKGILELLTELPWWIGVIFSAISYIGLKWIIPAIKINDPFLKGFSQALPNMAETVAIILLIPALISAFHAWRKKRLLDDLNVKNSIRDLSWKEFEEIIAEMFRRKGYTVIENADLGPDGGIDVTLMKNGSTFLVQCKHWKKQKVGVNIVREMFGVMTAENATGVMIITSGFFTQEAQNFSNDKAIELIDGDQLSSLLEVVQMSKKKPPDSTTKREFTDTCPQCGNQLVIRTAKRGQYLGNKFYGCSSFPRCRFTKAI